MLDMLIECLFGKWRRHPNNDVCSLPLPALSSGRNPRIQSYLINTLFSFNSLHFFNVFDTTSSTLSHHQSCLLHWFPQASEWFEKFYTFFFKIQVIGGSIGYEFSWFSGSTYLPCFKTDRKKPPSAPGHMAQLEVTTWSGQVCHEANMAGKLAFEDRNR